jgi:hypothetical protein
MLKLFFKMDLSIRDIFPKECLMARDVRNGWMARFIWGIGLKVGCMEMENSIWVIERVTLENLNLLCLGE